MTLIKSFYLNEEKNKIEIKDLIFNKKFEIINLDKDYLEYVDKEKQKNSIKLNKKNDKYSLKGSFFNANKLIDELLSDDDNSNDHFTRHYTIGNIYENANSAGIWTSMSNYWSIDGDTVITPHDSSTFYRNSFYVGDQNTVSYGNNWNENMDSSVINFGDRVSNPSRSFQISFLASGASVLSRFEQKPR